MVGTQFIYHAFTADALVAIANRELSSVRAQTRIKRINRTMNNVLPGLIHATTTRGADVLIHVWNYGNRQETLCVRGIHRIADKRGRFALMCNGQATKGLHTYLFNGEQGDAYVALDDDIARYVEENIDVDASLQREKVIEFQGFAERACNGPLEAIRLAS